MPRTKRQLTPIIVKDEVNPYIRFMHEASVPFSKDEENIQFIFNIAPEGFMGSDSESFLEEIKSDIENLIKLREFVQTIHSIEPIKVANNFNLEDGDLLIQVYVPKTHPLFAHLFLEP